ncbi:DUF2798 domain-containing protein [Vibrio breoganii]|uniref:DUF2798 domain-containing protein n=1 Tax=Vibrio breoganii TaxID=553239 RepID=UPI000C837616|nr:DUF2798 domain-containing protein [Vibrio breoganii]PMG10071.1 hypothetical protein BCV00_04280 [Vibrio breoganii]PMK31216.1 hypothetical protein BCU03_07780 [Vibrio breoganii]PML16336.1 hypothetical protein BCT84_06295 [Vibrio breoganii]PML35885.1 hypothetical protein BCT78_11755 [Vibrio breoganii]
MNAIAAMPIANSEEKRTPLFLKVLAMMGMMTLMGGSITGLMAYLNQGYSELFYAQWIRAFLTAAVTVMPLGFAFMALLTKLAERLFPSSSEKVRNISIGLIMALVMESGMAFSTAVNSVGIADTSMLMSTWLDTLIRALPLALLLMAVVSATLKPKVERFLKN